MRQHYRCRELQANNLENAASVKLVTYPGAYHAFDVADLQQGLSLKGADGRDHWLQYHKQAHLDAVGRVRSFLADHLARQ